MASSQTDIREIESERSENDYKNETWLNLYAREISDLAIIDIEHCKLRTEFGPAASGLIASLVEVDAEKDADILLKGLRTLDAFMVSNEYPKRNLTTAVFEILRKGCDGKVDPVVLTEAYRVASKLLRFVLPSTPATRRYWGDVLFTFLGDQPGIGKQEMQLRLKFIDVLKNVAHLTTTDQLNERQLHGITAYVLILCELLEIDFLFTLVGNAKNMSAAFISAQNSPHIASIFWPHKVAFGVERMQTDLLKPMIEILCSNADVQIQEVVGRMLAVIIEMVRLTHKEETAEAVCFSNPPERLSKLLTDIQFMQKEASQRVSRSIPFNWLSHAMRYLQSTTVTVQ